MTALRQVPVASLALSRFDAVLPGDGAVRVREAAARARSTLAGRVVWNVNSTARGGGWRRCW